MSDRAREIAVEETRILGEGVRAAESAARRYAAELESRLKADGEVIEAAKEYRKSEIALADCTNDSAAFLSSAYGHAQDERMRRRAALDAALAAREGGA